METRRRVGADTVAIIGALHPALVLVDVVVISLRPASRNNVSGDR